MANPRLYTTTAASRELKWSVTEKIIARRAFESALRTEFDRAVKQAKDRLAKAIDFSQLWDLEDFLGTCHQEIARQYDFRYSVLPMVFADLIRSGRLSEESLRGLDEGKIRLVKDLVTSASR